MPTQGFAVEMAVETGSFADIDIPATYKTNPNIFTPGYYFRVRTITQEGYSGYTEAIYIIAADHPEYGRRLPLYHRIKYMMRRTHMESL